MALTRPVRRVTVLLLGACVLLAGWIAFPRAWESIQYRRVWVRTKTGPPFPLADPRWPVIGWVQEHRRSGKRSGRSLFWFEETGTLAVVGSENGVTHYFDPHGSSLGRLHIEKLMGTLKEPLLETPPKEHAIAPWRDRGWTADEWWEFVDPTR